MSYVFKKYKQVNEPKRQSELKFVTVFRLTGSSIFGENEPGSNRDVLLVATGKAATGYGKRGCKDERSYSQLAGSAPNPSTYNTVNKMFI